VFFPTTRQRSKNPFEPVQHSRCLLCGPHIIVQSNHVADAYDVSDQPIVCGGRMFHTTMKITHAGLLARANFISIGRLTSQLYLISSERVLCEYTQCLISSNRTSHLDLFVTSIGTNKFFGGCSCVAAHQEREDREKASDRNS